MLGFPLLLYTFLELSGQSMGYLFLGMWVSSVAVSALNLVFLISILSSCYIYSNFKEENNKIGKARAINSDLPFFKNQFISTSEGQK